MRVVWSAPSPLIPESPPCAIFHAAQSHDGRLFAVLYLRDGALQLVVCALTQHALVAPALLEVSASSFVFLETRGVRASFADEPHALTLLCRIEASSLVVHRFSGGVVSVAAAAAAAVLPVDGPDACIVGYTLDCMRAMVCCASSESLVHVAVNESGQPKVTARMVLAGARLVASWLANGALVFGLLPTAVALWHAATGLPIATLALPDAGLAQQHPLATFVSFDDNGLLTLRGQAHVRSVDVAVALSYAPHVRWDLLAAVEPAALPALDPWTAIEPWSSRLMPVANAPHAGGACLDADARCLVRRVGSLRDLCIEGSLSDAVCALNGWPEPAAALALAEAVRAGDARSAAAQLALVPAAALPAALRLLPADAPSNLLALARARAAAHLATHPDDIDGVAAQLARLRPLRVPPLLDNNNNNATTEREWLSGALPDGLFDRWDALSDAHVAADGVRLGKVASAAAFLALRGVVGPTEAFAAVRASALRRAFAVAPVAPEQAARLAALVGEEPEAFLRGLLLQGTHRRVRVSLCRYLALSPQEARAAALMDELEAALPGSSFAVAMRRSFAAHGFRCIGDDDDDDGAADGERTRRTPANARRRWPRFGPARRLAASPTLASPALVGASASSSLRPGDDAGEVQPMKEPASPSGLVDGLVAAAASDDALTAMLRLSLATLMRCTNAEFIRIEAGLPSSPEASLAFAVAHCDFGGVEFLAASASDQALAAAAQNGSVAKHVAMALTDRFTLHGALRTGAPLDRFADALHAAGAAALLPRPPLDVLEAANGVEANARVSDAVDAHDAAAVDEADAASPLHDAPPLRLVGRPVTALRLWLLQPTDASLLRALPAPLAQHVAICLGGNGTAAPPQSRQSRLVDAAAHGGALLDLAVELGDPVLARAAALLPSSDADACALAELRAACAHVRSAAKLSDAAAMLLARREWEMLRVLDAPGCSLARIGKIAEFALHVRAADFERAGAVLDALSANGNVVNVVNAGANDDGDADDEQAARAVARSLVDESLPHPRRLVALLSVLVRRWPGEFGALHRRARFCADHGVPLQPAGDVVGQLLSEGDFAAAHQAVYELLGPAAKDVASRVALAHAQALVRAADGDADVWPAVYDALAADCDWSAAAEFFLAHGQAELAARVAVASNVDAVQRALAFPDSSLALAAVGRPGDAVDALLRAERLHEATQLCKLLRVDAAVVGVVETCQAALQAARDDPAAASASTATTTGEAVGAEWPGARALLAKTRRVAVAARALGVAFDLAWELDGDASEAALAAAGRVDLVTAPALLAAYVGGDAARAAEVAGRLDDDDALLALADLLPPRSEAAGVVYRRAGHVSLASVIIV